MKLKPIAFFALGIAAVFLMGQAAIQTFPPNTVWGRIGVGQYGPGGAISLSTLVQNLGLGVPSHSIVIGTGSTGTSFNGAVPSTAGQILIDQGANADPAFKPMSGSCTITSAGVVSCSNLGGGTRIVTTATDTVLTSDCFKTIEVNYSTGVSMETLPAATSFSDGCPIWFKNVGTRGVGLVNFPSMQALNQPILYPSQSLLIQKIGGNWTPVSVPGRYQVIGINVYVDNVNGCANTALCSGLYADGLASGVGAFSTPSQAFGFLYAQVDNMNSHPNVLLTAGQSYAECDSLQGQLTGTNVGFIIGNGGNVNWSTSGPGCSSNTAALNIGDNAEWEIQNVTFVMNANPSYGIFLHQTGVVDILNGVHFTGSSNGTTAIGSDHGGFVNLQSASTMNLSGTITVFLGLGQGTQVNLGPVQFSWVGTVAMTDLISIQGAGTSVNTATISAIGTTPAGLVRDVCNGPSAIALNGQTLPGSAGTPGHGCQVY